MNENLFLNQLKAADYASKAINDFFLGSEKQIPGLESLQNKSSLEIARVICLPTVVSSAVNFLYQKSLIGDFQGKLRVGDFYKFMLPEHFFGKTGLSIPYDQGWRVIDSLGNTYHHAAAAFLSIFGIKTYSLFDFPDLSWVLNKLNGKKYFLGLSFESRFILEKTLDDSEIKKISEIYPGFGEKKSRHIVGAFLNNETGNLNIYDPFDLLPENESSRVNSFEISEVESYFFIPKQALVFSLMDLDFPKVNLKNLYIPEKTQARTVFLSQELKNQGIF